MKNKRIIAFLVAFSLLQLLFPVGLLIYERNFMRAVIEKGESYTLSYTHITNMNSGVLYTNADEIYTVGYRWDYENAKYVERPYRAIGDYTTVGVEKNADGTLDFFDTEQDKDKLTDYNWFRPFEALVLKFDSYEFVREDFGMKELFELSLSNCEEEYGDTTTFEKFMQTEDGVYNTLFHIDLEGKIVLSVYKGFAVIKEFYIGDELVLKHN